MDVVDLTRQQAYDASKLCLLNAREYIEDAKMHYEKRRLQHIRIPFQFSLEEAGKARAMIDQLQHGAPTIQMNYQMRKGHQIKVDYIKTFVKVSPQKEQEYDDAWSGFPFLSPTAEPVFTGEAEAMRQLLQKQIASKATKSFVGLDESILDDLVTNSHEKRLGTLVNFDDTTRNPMLDDAMSEGDCLLLIDTISNMLDNFDAAFAQIRP